MIKKKILKRVTTSYAGENLECEKQYMNGDLALEFFPQVSIILEIFFSFLLKRERLQKESELELLELELFTPLQE